MEEYLRFIYFAHTKKICFLLLCKILGQDFRITPYFITHTILGYKKTEVKQQITFGTSALFLIGMGLYGNLSNFNHQYLVKNSIERKSLWNQRLVQNDDLNNIEVSHL